jgi:16S rRNA (guanine(966)-N(2))-methyltransferase RsmD
MAIRICGGRFGSIKLNSPGSGVRPTTDRVKEAIFSTLMHNLLDAHVLDLFAGSGALGCEAISRGASRVTFVEQSRECIETIRKNISLIGILEHATIIRSDAAAFVASCRDTYDLIFMDPPYHKGLASDLAPHVYNLLTTGGILVVEHERGEEIPLTTWKHRHYGDTSISYFTRSEQ